MAVLPITIHHKHAVYTGAIPYVCGNSDYEVVFTFDAGWEAFVQKTVRFCVGEQCVDRIITGNVCPVPVFESGDFLQIGVYAGNLQTSTAAMVRMCDSIRTAGGVPAEPEPAVYDQIMERLNSASVGKHISDYRILSQPDTAMHTLVLIYSDGTEMAIPLPQMGIDIDDVIQFGTSDPTGNTGGATKQLYINTSTGKMWVCKNGLMRPVQWISLSGGRTEIIDDGETVTVKFGG